MSAEAEPLAPPDPGPRPKPHIPPATSIRAPAPRPKRLSRKVLIAGALVIGLLVGFALLNGLSEQERTYAREDAPQPVQAAIPPDTVRSARRAYNDADLRPPDEDADYFWGEPRPAEYEAGADESGLVRQPPAPAQPNPAEVEAETARTSGISFGRQPGAAPATSGGVRDVGQRSAFLASQRGRDDGVLDAAYRPPRSPYTIQAGATISAALVTGLNSDQPGRAIAQVTENVYDSVTGAYLLIPQGARLIGTYDSDNAYGDRRLLVVWNRLVMPNGWSIALRGMPGTDASGASGLQGRVDAHLGRIAVASLLSGALSVAANEAEGDDDQRFVAGVGDAAAQEAARVGGRIVERELNVRPTIRIDAGARVRVLVSQDIVLRPYAR